MATSRSKNKRGSPSSPPPPPDATPPDVPPIAPDVPDAAPQVTLRAVDALIPYARNARTHSDAQIAQLAGSIAEFGWTNPVLADEHGIVAGHGRVLAARKLYDSGATLKLPDGRPLPAGTVPVIDCTGWQEAKRRAYVIADNKLALNAGWDNALLALELEEIVTSGFDLDVVGFDADEMHALANVLANGVENVANIVVNGDRFLVLVECKDEPSQQRLFTELNERGDITCKLLS